MARCGNNIRRLPHNFGQSSSGEDRAIYQILRRLPYFSDHAVDSKHCNTALGSGPSRDLVIFFPALESLLRT